MAAAVVALAEEVGRCVDEPAFWKAFGQTSKEARGRVALALAAAAALDEPLRLALHAVVGCATPAASAGRVARAVHGDSEVNSLDSSDEANAFELQPYCQSSTADSAAPLFSWHQSGRGKTTNGGGVESVSDSDEDTLDESDLQDDEPLYAIKPGFGIIRIMPGFAPLPCRIAWFVLIAFFLAFDLYLAIWKPEDTASPELALTPLGMAMDHFVTWTCLAMCIPLSTGIQRIAQSQALASALRHKACGPSSDGEGFGRASLVTPTSVLLVYTTITWVASVQVGGMTNIKVLIQLLWLVVDFHVSTFMISFMFIWKVTWNLVDDMRSDLETGCVADWSNFTRQYNYLERLLSELWGCQNFGLSFLAFFIICSVDGVMCAAEGIASRQVPSIALEFSVASLEVLLIFFVLFKMAWISTKCQSTYRYDKSVLGLALQCAGTVAREQRTDYELFLRCVSLKPAGIVMWPIGTITMSIANLWLRVFIVLVPGLVGLAALKHQQHP